MPAPTTKVAAALRSVAQLVDDGLPAPLTIVTREGAVEVQVLAGDLADWLIALNAPLPIWEAAEGDTVGRYEKATWPLNPFADQPFTVTCYRTVVDLVEPTC